MRKTSLPPILVVIATVLGFLAYARVAKSSIQAQTPASVTGHPLQAPSQPVAQALTTVVLDPAHGGTDEGAHGAGGILEKDVTLGLAQLLRARLVQEGFQVVMTRQTDKTLSFSQRAAIANAQSNSIFVSLHVGSSGPVGNAYAFYYDFGALSEPTPPAKAGMVGWDQAQRAWEPYSHRLASLVQVELAARLPGSPEFPEAAEVYQLRAINSPAIAVEMENVNATSESALAGLGAPLAQAIALGIQSFRTVYQAEVR